MGARVRSRWASAAMATTALAEAERRIVPALAEIQSCDPGEQHNHKRDGTLHKN